jgi:hypothetical protein
MSEMVEQVEVELLVGFQLVAGISLTQQHFHMSCTTPDPLVVEVVEEVEAPLLVGLQAVVQISHLLLLLLELCASSLTNPPKISDKGKFALTINITMCELCEAHGKQKIPAKLLVKLSRL